MLTQTVSTRQELVSFVKPVCSIRLHGTFFIKDGSDVKVGCQEAVGSIPNCPQIPGLGLHQDGYKLWPITWQLYCYCDL